MLRNAGVSNSGVMTTETSVPPCLKMWFPMDETSGTVITDVVNGAVLTPDEISFAGPNCVQLHVETKGLTSGSFPAVADKDFILFGVYRGLVTPESAYPTGMIRAEATLRLKTAGNGQVSYYDGDGFDIQHDGATYGVGTESLYGAICADKGVYCHAGIATIRKGNSGALWLHNNDYWHGGQPHGFSGPYVQNGSILSRNFRNSINANGFNTEGVCVQSDYGVDPKFVDYYYSYTSGSPPSLFDPEFTTNEYASGIAGTWGKLDMADAPFSLGAFSTISIGSQINRLTGVNIEYYGLALFVFDNGLPEDFREALRWMREQWMLGNKVIWPDWVTVA